MYHLFNNRLIQLSRIQIAIEQFIFPRNLSMSSDNIAICGSNPGKKYQIGGPQERYLTLRDEEL